MKGCLTMEIAMGTLPGWKYSTAQRRSLYWDRGRCGLCRKVQAVFVTNGPLQKARVGHICRRCFGKYHRDEISLWPRAEQEQLTLK